MPRPMPIVRNVFIAAGFAIFAFIGAALVWSAMQPDSQDIEGPSPPPER